MEGKVMEAKAYSDEITADANEFPTLGAEYFAAREASDPTTPAEPANLPTDVADIVKMLLSPEHAYWLTGVAAAALNSEHRKVEAIREAFRDDDIGAGEFSRRVGEILGESPFDVDKAVREIGNAIWCEKMAAREGDLDPTTGLPDPTTPEMVPPAGERIRSTQDGSMEAEPVTGQSPVGSASHPTTPEAQAIADLERRLSLRDTFISEKGLWSEFADTVLRAEQATEESR